ncbi:MAG TPA: hypothetical protein VJQ43_03670, partial [Thermoplasmata archaeon]|nr:hypothetical protein [Thermoplasmata archaeon]
MTFTAVSARLAVALVVVMLVATAAPSLAGTPQPAGTPGPLSPSFTNNGVSPPPTYRGATAYDAADGSVVMFGGFDTANAVTGATWTFGHGNWTNLTPLLSVVPSPRWGAGIAYDPVDGYIVMFGGAPDSSGKGPYADTWTFGHGKWTDLTPTLARSPPARELPSMTWDAGAGAIVLFGGGADNSSFVALNDTWEFVHGNWTEVPTAVAPLGRMDAGFAFDPSLNETVLFGGLGSSAVLDDTWTFHNRTWSVASGTTAPSARRATVMVYDPGDGYLFLATGYDAGTYRGDTWTFGSAGWSPLATNGAVPGGIFGSEAAYDVSDGYVLFFSGFTDRGLATTTWTYAGGHWTAYLAPPPAGFSFNGIALLPLVLFPLAFGGAFVATTLRNRKMWRRLANGFPSPPGINVRWAPTPKGALPARWGVGVVFLILPIVFVLPVLAGGGPILVPLAFGAIFLVLGPAFLLLSRGFRVQRVGIARDGVIFEQRRGTVRIPWADLQPPIMPAQAARRSVFFRYANPDAKGGAGAVEVTVDQGRAILTAPESPGYSLSPVVASSLGISTNLRSGSVPPPPPPPPPPIA